MKKYGLQLKVQPPLEKKRLTPPVSTSIFGDNDEDNVEMEIIRQAHKNKFQRDIEEQQKKALEEDPSVFDYDGVYDKMKEKQIRPIQQERQDRKPKYIQALIDKAKQREREHEIIYERKLSKERSVDEHLYADKDRFVTGAYKKKLAEQAKWLEVEKLREIREEKEDVTKKTDLSDFYFNLSKNTAFGAGSMESSKPATQQPEQPSTKPQEYVSPPPSARPESHGDDAKSHHQVMQSEILPEDLQVDEPHDDQKNQGSNDGVESNLQPPSAPKDPQRTSADALAAAKERFLARKKAKTQQG